jgi:hypothetical protein
MEGKGGSSRGKQTAAIDCRDPIWYNKFPGWVNFLCDIDGGMNTKGKHCDIRSCILLLHQTTAAIMASFFPHVRTAGDVLVAQTIHEPMALETVQYNSCDYFIDKHLYCQVKIKYN